jgi:hypothetical protein
LGTFGIFLQAGAMLMAGLLHREGEVAQQVPAICHLDCVRGGFLDRSGIGTGPVPAHHFGSRVLAQPSGQRLGGSVRQDIDRPTGLDVDQNGSVADASPEGELVHP